MKKLLMYVDSMNPSGGIERVVSNLANSFVDKLEVYLLTKDDLPSYYYLDQRVHCVSLGLKKLPIRSNRIGRMQSFASRMILSRKGLRTFLQQKSVDYIYTATVLTSLEVVTLGKQYQKRLVISEHGSYFGYNKLYTWIKKLIYPKAYALSVPTKLDTETYLSLGYPAHFIPHISTFKACERSSLNKKTVLNVGRLTFDKNQINLLDVWKSLSETGENVGWVLRIVGSGEEENSLRRYIEDNELQSSVELISATPDIAKEYLSSSIFAFTSRNEGFGMVLLEAMSFGIPCISYDCPSGPRDMIVDGVNGFLITNGNQGEFKSKLGRMMRMSHAELSLLGNKAFELVESWNNDEILEKWYMLFTACCEQDEA